MRRTSFDYVNHVSEFQYSEKTAEPICEDGILYIEDDAFAAYNCPCGCGRVVMIPLAPKIDYGWKWREENGKVTLSPSVYSTGFDCKSHYFITDNKIRWCG